MHIVLIADADRMRYEWASLQRLAGGLAAAGTEITWIVPLGIEPWPGFESGGGQVESRIEILDVPMRVLPWTRRMRTQRVTEVIEKSPPDVIFAVGQGAWPLGVDVASSVERPLAIDVWAAPLVRHVPRGRRAECVAGYVAPTAPIAEALRERVDPGLVSLVPWGVDIPQRPREVLDRATESIGLGIIGSGHDLSAYRNVLTALSQLVRKYPQIQAILELRGPREHDIWRLARHLNLLDHISAVGNASRHHALFTDCDLLILPEALGQMRSLVLEAMAAGVPVVAKIDPHLDMLGGDSTAVLIGNGGHEEWAGRLEGLISRPDSARTIGRNAREWMASHHRAEEEAVRLMATFDRLVTGGAMAFPRTEAG